MRDSSLPRFAARIGLAASDVAFPLAIALVLTLGFASPAYAYVDPSVMTYTIQALAGVAGIGGGLCNLANTIHRVVLVSPLTVTEFHKHSDALAPDEGPRVPFSSGTSVFYNNGDYRFKNETDQTFQLLLWCDEDNLYAELRCERPLPCRYRIVEEGHHFQKEGGKYYRVSKIYKETLDAQTGQLLHRELVLDNHSEVMYDPALIPGVEKL